nr:MAG TPA_asm: hypothetical protein [Bacteriophage sp.]
MSKVGASSHSDLVITGVPNWLIFFNPQDLILFPTPHFYV